jgi:predicted small metal-binding protein
MGVDDGFIAKGMTNEEVMKKMEMHAKMDHADMMANMSEKEMADMKEKMMANIKDEM